MEENETTIEPKPTPTDSGSNGPHPELPGVSQATLDIARDALAEETPKRKLGRPITSGKWVGQSAKRKLRRQHQHQRSAESPVSMDDLAPSTSDPFVEVPSSTPAVPAPVEIPMPEPFNREAEKPYVESALEMCVLIRAEIKRGKILRQTKDADFAALLADKTEIPEKLKPMLMQSGLDCCEKYHVSISRFPEGSFIGGLFLWLRAEARATQAAVAQYFKERGGQETPAGH
jgi:hypothetical protein